MKLVFGFIFGLQMFADLAQANAFESYDFEGVACAQVSSMAVLAKDNIPYWAAPENDEAVVESCYEVTREVISVGTPQDVEMFQSSFRKNVRIFNNDIDFARFIEENEGREALKLDPNNIQHSSFISTGVPLVPLF